METTVTCFSCPVGDLKGNASLTNLIKHAKVTADWSERANNLTTSVTECSGAVETRTAKSSLKVAVPVSMGQSSKSI